MFYDFNAAVLASRRAITTTFEGLERTAMRRDAATMAAMSDAPRGLTAVSLKKFSNLACLDGEPRPVMSPPPPPTATARPLPRRALTAGTCAQVGLRMWSDLGQRRPLIRE